MFLSASFLLQQLVFCHNRRTFDSEVLNDKPRKPFDPRWRVPEAHLHAPVWMKALLETSLPPSEAHQDLTENVMSFFYPCFI